MQPSAPVGPPPGADPAPRLDLERARTATELVSAALEIYVRYWRGFLLMSFAVVLPLTVLFSGVVAGMLWHSYDGTLTVTQAYLPAIESALITAPLVTAVHVRAVQAIGRGERPPVIAAVRQGLDALPVVAGAVLLSLLATVLGFVAFILPGIYVGVRLAFSAQAVVAEERRAIDAVRRSWRLVEARWWRTFGLLLLLNIVGGSVGRLLSAPLDAAAIASDSGAVAVLVRALTATLSLSITALVTTLIFFDLSARACGSVPRAGAPPGLDRPERIV